MLDPELLTQLMGGQNALYNPALGATIAQDPLAAVNRLAQAGISPSFLDRWQGVNDASRSGSALDGGAAFDAQGANAYQPPEGGAATASTGGPVPFLAPKAANAAPAQPATSGAALAPPLPAPINVPSLSAVTEPVGAPPALEGANVKADEGDVEKKAAKFVSALRGVQAPAAPQVQRISSPSIPATHALPGRNPTVDAIMAALAGGSKPGVTLNSALPMGFARYRQS